ncbi:MAG: GrpB family protein [Waterburya sp.]
MIAHPQDAEQYSLLKQELAEKHPYNIESYMDGKNDFIKRIEKKALQWLEESKILYHHHRERVKPYECID